MFNNTFNNIKTLVKDSFSLVKKATIGTVESISQDLSTAKKRVTDFRAFVKWQESQEAEQKSTATRTGAKE